MLSPYISGYSLIYCTSAAIQPDGKLLMSGKLLYQPLGPDLYVIRVNQDGSIDTSFGNQGIVTFDIINSVNYSYISLDEDGKIVFETYFNESQVMDIRPFSG